MNDVDGRLVDLVGAAERDEACPHFVNVLAGSWFIQGRPVSAEQFVARTHDSLFHGLEKSRDGRKMRGTPDERQQQLLDLSVPMIEAVNQREPGESDSLNLVDVTIAGPTGPSLHVPAVRVPLGAVVAWWLTDFQVKNTGGGSSVGIAVAF